MQAISVGLVMALLVNRSDAVERAVPRHDNTTDDGRDVNSALYRGADAFAKKIASRHRRSSGEQSLKSGYALSEARRRLSGYILETEDLEGSVRSVYIGEEGRDAVVRFLAKDLARRPALTDAKLAEAFDALVDSFRITTGALAWRGMVFERASETNALRSLLLSSFNEARNSLAGDR